MREVWATLRRFAATDAPVLITGESGTGKEVVARAIHAASRRRHSPIMALGCAALPSELIASALWGDDNGALGGAARTRISQIEHGDGGTLFLDEIGDMPIDLQIRLLRFLREKQITRAGGRGEAIGVDVRIVAATNVDPQALLQSGRLREDLFFRLNVLSLHLPPLRDRSGDLEPLTRRFLAESAALVGRPVPTVTPATMARLAAHDWPGNVRELQSAIFRAVVMCDGDTVLPEDLLLTASTWRNPLTNAAPDAEAASAPVGRPVRIDRSDLLEVLARHANNVTAAAAEWQISRVTLYRLLRRFEITLER